MATIWGLFLGNKGHSRMMAEVSKRYRIFLSAAEPSGDAHCAALINALRQGGEIDSVGVGGPRMAEAGCELLETTVGRAAMIYKAFSHVPHYYGLIRRVRRYLMNNSVDLVVVCDSPSFNFHIAKAAKKAGASTVFYVAPQLWAWAGWRIRKMRKRCDKLCCLLPFEEAWFGQRGIDAVYVGNPLLDNLPADLSGFRKQYSDFEPAQVVVALMPGSRAAEIDSLWRPMQEIALRIRQKYAGASFVTVAVDDERRQILEASQIEGFECRYTIGSVSDTASEADFAIVASGSATLQVAGVGCPMVIMYQSSKILWHVLGRWLVKAKYLSLVNVLAGRELAPEFMPYFTSVEPIVRTIEQILKDKDKLTRMSNELIELAQPLRVGSASQKAAQIVREMLGQGVA
jgi:lipid-A-disaccharide synthase